MLYRCGCKYDSENQTNFNDIPYVFVLYKYVLNTINLHGAAPPRPTGTAKTVGI